MSSNKPENNAPETIAKDVKSQADTDHQSVDAVINQTLIAKTAEKSTPKTPTSDAENKSVKPALAETPETKAKAKAKAKPKAKPAAKKQAVKKTDTDSTTRIVDGEVEPTVKVRDDDPTPPKASDTTAPKTDLKAEIMGGNSDLVPYNEPEQSRFITAAKERIEQFPINLIGVAAAMQLSHSYYFDDEQGRTTPIFGIYLGTNKTGKLMIQEMDKGKPTEQRAVDFDKYRIREISNQTAYELSFLK